ncbi:hypothetical protein Rsub_05432 [Raphidocelis subcapitata]|uniref:Uncharacterized protein n=1 Tax=Raphidocelis subcapitata TaxID=307507 RepID=A0A2V0P4M8_9CHLO|nr:hypothetical protein Rsub_05432 [Raphidocelis subcapitata]|eukprot:GBF92813.1 hypothetical protein Rsub_05432 [Raphidocelis subcapitata]
MMMLLTIALALAAAAAAAAAAQTEPAARPLAGRTLLQTRRGAFGGGVDPGTAPGTVAAAASAAAAAGQQAVSPMSAPIMLPPRRLLSPFTASRAPALQPEARLAGGARGAPPAPTRALRFLRAAAAADGGGASPEPSRGLLRSGKVDVGDAPPEYRDQITRMLPRQSGGGGGGGGDGSAGRDEVTLSEVRDSGR